MHKQSPGGVLWKRFLKNFTKFTGKHLCQSLFFNKVAGLRSATLLKKRLWHRYFPVNFAKFLKTPFFTEHLWLLLLYLRQINRHQDIVKIAEIVSTETVLLSTPRYYGCKKFMPIHVYQIYVIKGIIIICCLQKMLYVKKVCCWNFKMYIV